MPARSPLSPPAPARGQRRPTRASPRDAGIVSRSPVGGQRERGMRRGQRQQSRNCAHVAGRGGGRCSPAGPGRLRRGHRDPLAPGRRRVRPVFAWPRPCPAGAEPLPARSRSSPPSAGMGPPGEPHRFSHKVPPARAELCRSVCPRARPHRCHF